MVKISRANVFVKMFWNILLQYEWNPDGDRQQHNDDLQNYVEFYCLNCI